MIAAQWRWRAVGFRYIVNRLHMARFDEDRSVVPHFIESELFAANFFNPGGIRYYHLGAGMICCEFELIDMQLLRKVCRRGFVGRRYVLSESHATCAGSLLVFR